MAYREGPRGVIFGRLVGVEGVEDEDAAQRPAAASTTASTSRPSFSR